MIELFKNSFFKNIFPKIDSQIEKSIRFPMIKQTFKREFHSKNERAKFDLN